MVKNKNQLRKVIWERVSSKGEMVARSCECLREGQQMRFNLVLIWLSIAITFFAIRAQAQDIPADVILAQGLQPVLLQQALSQVKPGTVVVLGEQHGTTEQSSQQLQLIESIKKNGLVVSVGFEFFEAQYQDLVDRWRHQEISEDDFLKAIHWGSGFPFAAYRPQALAPRLDFGEQTIALNAKRSLTSKISSQGLDSLTESERAQLPPGFSLGNQRYFSRFKAIMQEHVPNPEALNRYFAAQSVWDDSMAFRAQQFIAGHPDQILVIIVGEFHVQYGGGLPDRLRSRGMSVTTFSLLNLQGLDVSEQQQAVEPSSEYGSRADYVWTSRFGLQ